MNVLFALDSPATPEFWTNPLTLFVLIVVGILLLTQLVGLRYISNDAIGAVEKLWSAKGSVSEGQIIALDGKAGYQADLLRGGFHFGYFRWQYTIHKLPLVTIPQGQIGYVYARDGEPLSPSQTLGRVIACNYFQDARVFLTGASEKLLGQRGRQRAILREGVYAINQALFIVITSGKVYRLPTREHDELRTVTNWQVELGNINGFTPVVIGSMVETPNPLIPEQSISVDSIGIVTVHDGPSLPPGEIIAPSVGNEHDDPNHHNNFQDPEAFLRANGRRGRQYVPLTDGTYFINRWFATIELKPKIVVPIGYVGVVVSYYGQEGQDVSGAAFRHGERVAEGQRGVWQKPLGPGKYPFNVYAGNIILVPTTNFVLHWITGKTESHRYDESLRSIDLVTHDAYEPLLPLSVVVHIDYQRAPSVIQRFGDVKKLITQTLDPMLSAYFRDVAHKKTLLQLLQERDLIQKESREELKRKFNEFDIECVDVLIGKPSSSEGDSKIENLLEQLRLRQLSTEQIETYERQRAAAEKLRTLNDATAIAAMQTSLTNSSVQVRIAENQGEADLAKARKQAEQLVVLAQAESQQKILAGRGEGSQRLQIGLSEAAVLLRKISSYGDPRLYALALVAEHMAASKQPLVPERVFLAGGAEGSPAGANPTNGMLGMLIQLLVAEKSGFNPGQTDAGQTALQEFAEKMSKDAMESMQQSTANIKDDKAS